MDTAVASAPAVWWPDRRSAVVQIGALLGAVIVAVATSRTEHWTLLPMFVIATFTIASDLTSVESGARKVRISGSLLGLTLAAVLLGGGPAALIGIAAIALGWPRFREAPHFLLNNLTTYAWAPLGAGIFFHAVVRAADLGPDDLSYYLAVFATFVVALGLNALGVTGYHRYLEGGSLRAKLRQTLEPVLASELFSGLLTMAAVFVAIKMHTVGLAVLGLVLVIFQYLAGQLLVSQSRSKKLQRMATTDELTGLANRERFRQRVEERIASGDLFAPGFGVMLIDLDHFKEINDTLGHDYGDVMLRDLGPRLADCVGPGGTVARLGGDEFAVLPAQRSEDADVLEPLATALLACIEQPFEVDELSLQIAASIGIARYPADGADSHTLLRRADVAMYQAKDAHAGYKLYDSSHDRHSVRKLSVLSEVRKALMSDQMVVYYQPIIDLGELRTRGAEALVRWEHPELGLLPPAAFIQATEQTGLIGPLTRMVLDRSLAQCAAWRAEGKNLSVAVNLSVRNLLDRTLPRDIEQMLSKHGVSPSSLQLEITERMIMSDPERVLATVRRLTDLGVSLSVDDFGTGYSSLANLRQLPINELKIDRSFVTPMLQQENDLIIVRSTINLGHDLGLRIIAEGVEDADTLARLGLLGCDRVQGYHVSRPMPAAAMDRWLEGGQPESSNASSTSSRTPNPVAPLSR